MDALEIVIKLEKCIALAQKINYAAMRLKFPLVRKLVGELSNTLPYLGAYQKSAGTLGRGPNGLFIFDAEAAEYFLTYSMKAYWQIIKAYKRALKNDLEGCGRELDGIQGTYGAGLDVAARKYEDMFPASLIDEGLINPI